MSRTPAKSIDKVLTGLVVLLVGFGFLIFSSASLGLLARDGASFGSVASSQFLFGIVGGSLALFAFSSLHYRHLRRYAFYIFLATVALTLAVFIPGLGMTHGGATRWISIGGFTLQPAELLKIGFVIYIATWLSGMKDIITDPLRGTLPFVGIVGVVAVVMLLQPDTDTFLIMGTAGLAMFIVAGGRWRDVGVMLIAGVLALAIIAMARPYVMDRLTTFLSPEDDPLGSGYQIQQSLIAVGSGGVTGRGFGQSIQKFEYLPEPIGDSIFAVYAEEFGFIGSSFLILLYLAFTFRGYKVAAQSPDLFGTLLVVGFMTIIVCQAFLNIGAMLGVAPLSGLPLPFISHGGTALLATLAMVGIVLNVSKYREQKRRT
ncbi:MAG: putative lipid II flippase FtsW [Candidatus Pacebacteria bacterium]|jgi:cell division protein FtsW|nr:putative lipid II flippase FtsW [Candidatus Paceibacterota bacterium]